MIRDCGKPIKGWEIYGILENGTVRNNWNGHELKPDKDGCVCLRNRGKNARTKTFSIARLVAINWLNMPDDNKYIAYKKDPNGGLNVSNIAWAPKHEALSIVHKRSYHKKEAVEFPEVID